MKIKQHLDKNNLHHAYLIEGNKTDILPEFFVFLSEMGIETKGNPDFTHIDIDSFKIDEAFFLRDMSNQKAFSENKKIFIISANSFSPDAQNAMLKMFEEPTSDTHFFIIVPEVDALIRTLMSRLYLIKDESENINTKEAEKFIEMNFSARIEFLKELLAEVEDSEDEESGELETKTLSLESKRSKSLKFLNSLELALHNKLPEFNTSSKFDINFFDQIFQARKFIRQPGSSAKTLLESVALSIPEGI